MGQESGRDDGHAQSEGRNQQGRKPPRLRNMLRRIEPHWSAVLMSGSEGVEGVEAAVDWAAADLPVERTRSERLAQPVKQRDAFANVLHIVLHLMHG